MTGFNALTYTYLVEIFPYTIRAKGITMQQLFGRLATFINVFVNPIGLDTIGWRYYLWYCVWITVEIIVIYCIFPETSKHTLEELAFCKWIVHDIWWLVLTGGKCLRVRKCRIGWMLRFSRGWRLVLVLKAWSIEK
jgi:MFS family permease